MFTRQGRSRDSQMVLLPEEGHAVEIDKMLRVPTLQKKTTFRTRKI